MTFSRPVGCSAFDYRSLLSQNREREFESELVVDINFSSSFYIPKKVFVVFERTTYSIATALKANYMHTLCYVVVWYSDVL